MYMYVRVFFELNASCTRASLDPFLSPTFSAIFRGSFFIHSQGQGEQRYVRVPAYQATLDHPCSSLIDFFQRGKTQKEKRKSNLARLILLFLEEISLVSFLSKVLPVHPRILGHW